MLPYTSVTISIRLICGFALQIAFLFVICVFQDLTDVYKVFKILVNFLGLFIVQLIGVFTFTQVHTVIVILQYKCFFAIFEGGVWKDVSTWTAWFDVKNLIQQLFFLILNVFLHFCLSLIPNFKLSFSYLILTP